MNSIVLILGLFVGSIPPEINYVPPAAIPMDVQVFASGAGNYTWTKPANAKIVKVFLVCAGGGGGGGGLGSNDSGGGGGGGGNVFHAHFNAESLNSTETIVLGQGGTGGARQTVNDTQGNNGGDPSETSFGTAARNILRCDPSLLISGSGGNTTQGNNGDQNVISYTVKILHSYATSSNGGVGEDTVDGTDATATSLYDNQFPLSVLRTAGGGGGGGTNGGAGFTLGGDGGNQTNSSGWSTFRNRSAGGGVVGANGSDGTDYQFDIVGVTSGLASLGFGTGGGGGAGSNTGNGGNGGRGGNCGGGGGGGGSALNGMQSGAGGDGGDGCVFVYSF